MNFYLRFLVDLKIKMFINEFTNDLFNFQNLCNVKLSLQYLKKIFPQLEKVIFLKYSFN